MSAGLRLYSPTNGGLVFDSNRIGATRFVRILHHYELDDYASLYIDFDPALLQGGGQFFAWVTNELGYDSLSTWSETGYYYFVDNRLYYRKMHPLDNIVVGVFYGKT